MTYRLKYRETAHHGRFATIRYPAANRPGYPTRERAEQVRAAMPEPDNFEVEQQEED